MKYIVSIFSILLLLSSTGHAKRYFITTSGMSFSPATLNVEVGDSLIFQTGGSHDAVEVSKATWDANGSASNGGFAIPFGGGSFVPRTAGTLYYVCTPHVSLGMKGMITVKPKSTTAVDVPPGAGVTLELLQNSPNPLTASSNGVISFRSSAGGIGDLRLYDLLGSEKFVVFHGQMEAGRTYDVHITASGLPAGRYLYRLEQGAAAVTRILTITR